MPKLFGVLELSVSVAVCILELSQFEIRVSSGTHNNLGINHNKHYCNTIVQSQFNQSAPLHIIEQASGASQANTLLYSH